ncbi:M20 metallopeptidase family protein [Pontibacillus marinus]|uniref:Carboxypeptidase n=1 Tax=Pontibacillus marinus BH030004 = DSM 16465 TaxID=1385511 RepID=A0A0A5GBR0_9BACI|nr:M20 family metallopeptidase [Pontibacillus marinus]KGX89464.1 carboxypeptidase [Pontibacillus marinus BH030004 = DSM 16465]
MSNILDLIKHIESDIITIRRTLHQNPELSNEEYETSRLVQETLTRYGIEFQSGFAETGVLGIIKGDKPGKTVALRADMDALPIQEANQHDHTSKTPGKMHACGHDAHTAMLLGTGYALQQLKDQIQGTVLLVFQPAEENAPHGGSQKMMDDGVFAKYQPDVIYGQHVWPYLPVGQIGIRDKEMMGASDRFSVTIRGRGGHASMPQDGNDAIIIANQVISSLQTIVSRNVNPLDSAVLTVGRIEGGYRYNVIPDKVYFEGTVRTYKPEVKDKVKKRFHQIIKQTVEAFDAEVEIEYLDGYPATINTPKWAQQARATAQHMLGDEATPSLDPVLAGEDFSRFLNQYPGAFIWLGTKIEDAENQKPLHDPAFKLNEKALPQGSMYMARLALETLENLQEKE